jgi:hypothetical protein
MLVFLFRQTSSPADRGGCRATGSFLFGYDSGIIGSVISANYDQFHLYFDHPSDAILGAIVSVFAGGAFCESPNRSRNRI